MARRTWLMVLLLAPAMLAAGCERARPIAAEATAGRLAARVNGVEISMHQVAGVAPGSGASAAQALDKVIDRELLVQKALAAKLDRDPQVAQALEVARRQVLAQAWLDRAASSAAEARSTAEEVSAFYAENPGLFAQRRVYRLRELTVTVPADRLETVRSEATTAKDLDELAGWLKWRSLKVTPATYTTAPAEQLPLAFLPQLARMREGELAVFPVAQGATVVQLIGAQDAPLSEREATPVIEQFISGRKRLELAATEVRRLREAANIEYVGDFKR
jgi:EpsD family peptidyl-prolyl cis-trans isomerase